MKLHSKILLGLVAGAVVGVGVNLATGGGPGTQRLVSVVTEPIGRMWLSALIMIVIPLIVSTLSLGVAGLGSLKRLGRIGIITIASFLCLTAASTALGLTLMNLVRPGASLDPAIQARLMEAYKGQTQGAMGLSENAFNIDLLVRIVPRNPVQAAANGDMLAVIFFSLMIGVALTAISAERAEPMVKFLDSLGHITVAIIHMVMQVAPIGVFCLIFSVTARFGFDLLLNLLMLYFFGNEVEFALGPRHFLWIYLGGGLVGGLARGGRAGAESQDGDRAELGGLSLHPAAVRQSLSLSVSSARRLPSSARRRASTASRYKRTPHRAAPNCRTISAHAFSTLPSLICPKYQERIKSAKAGEAECALRLSGAAAASWW